MNDANILIFYIFLLGIGGTILIRNNAVFKHKMRVTSKISSHLDKLIQKGLIESDYIQKYYSLALSPSYGKMLFNILVWDFDKYADLDNKKKALDAELLDS